MKNGINVISCFDGMACGMQALKEAGIRVNKYYAFEIDKYAIQVALKNHPEIIELGDINNWEFFDELEVPDLIIAGSPCQGFSNAGRGLNFDDPRSKLFFVFVELLNYWKFRNPDVKALLENVKMKKEWRDIITEHIGFEPVLINSALVSAQNRERYYWANWNFPQPEDEGIVLRDILEDEVDERLLLSEKELEYMNRETSDGRNHWDFSHHSSESNDKSSTVVANFSKGVPYNVLVRNRLDFVGGIGEGLKEASRNYRRRVYSDKGKAASLSAQGVGSIGGATGIYRIGTASDINGHDILKRIYSPEGKSPTLDAQGGGNREPKVVIGAYRGRYENDGTTKQQLEIRGDEKSNTLTTVQKDNVVVNLAIAGRATDMFGHDIQRRVYKRNSKSPTLLAIGSGGAIPPKVSILDIREYSEKCQKQIRKNSKPTDEKSLALTTNSNSTGSGVTTVDMLNGIHYRKLTVRECERLQTLPDDYTLVMEKKKSGKYKGEIRQAVSNSQRYKMIGNGWTIEVISHILSFLPEKFNSA